ncbi:MAG: hypothetical protein ACI8PZ_005756 [Myxococcota bacterium]|jgi:hypothetical protein
MGEQGPESDDETPHGPLIRRIERAFDGVPAPRLTRRSYDAAGERIGVPVVLPERWQDLDRTEVSRASLRLEEMEPEAFRYYLPAVLCSTLRGGGRGAEMSVAQALDLFYTGPTDTERSQARAAILTLPQCAVLEEAMVALDHLGGEPLVWRGLTWVRRHRDTIHSAADWWALLHDRHSHAAHLTAQVAEAFATVQRPDPLTTSLYQAEAADNGQSCDQSRDHVGRWQDLPDQHVLDCQWALPWLDAAGMQHYLPAIMTFLLRTSAVHDAEGWFVARGHLDDGYTWLGFGPEDGRVRFAGALGRFAWAQRQALGAFLLFHARDPTVRAGWTRLLEAERDGERSDWLAVLRGDAPIAGVAAPGGVRTTAPSA